MAFEAEDQPANRLLPRRSILPAACGRLRDGRSPRREITVAFGDRAIAPRRDLPDIEVAVIVTLGAYGGQSCSHRTQRDVRAAQRLLIATADHLPVHAPGCWRFARIDGNHPVVKEPGPSRHTQLELQAAVGASLM